MTDQSIGKLFLAGVVPGLMVSMFFLIYVTLRCLFNPALVPDRQDRVGRRITFAYRASGILEIWPFLLLIVAVLGSIYAGVATPTEASGVGALGALIIGASYRSLSWKALRSACFNTVRGTSMLFLIVITAKLLTLALAYYGAPTYLKAFAATVGSPYALLLLIAGIYLLLGAVFDDFSLMIVMLPFVVPLVQAAGFDLVWFGIFMTVLLQAGLLSPPVGMNLFVLQGVTGAPIGDVVRGSIPFMIILIAVAVIITLIPQLALWLPSAVG
jgi:tripartite ATP-independent transporter DctM subunit